MSPREIQSRLRAGATVAELAEESGMPVEAIDRFSGPPLAERSFVCEQARACIVRPGTDDLATMVARGLSGTARDDLAWDSWRRPDGRWTVIATTGDAEPLSTWVYDPRSRSVQPDDAASHRLASEDVVVPLPSARAERASTATITVEREPAATTADEPEPPAIDEPPAAEASADSSAQEAEDTAPSRQRVKSRKGKRASVPRWDEILFGAGQSET
ncbi:MAG: septation protein SepH [Candidatus Nanopelagicales bacterium]